MNAMPITQPGSQPTHQAGPTRFTPLAAPSMGSSEMSVWQVEVPPEAPEVPHQMTREEILVVLEGVARATVDGDVAEVRPGGTIVVPAGTTFSLSAAGPHPVVAVACLPVGGQARMPGEEPFTPPWAI